MTKYISLESEKRKMFAAPTVEYIQKDFESTEGFFCDNRDIFALHANDDGR